MNSVANGNQSVDTETEEQPVRRRRGRKPGRPKGRKAQQSNGDIALGKSKAAYRKWQRGFVKPQFTLTRDDATDLLHKFLRSRAGRGALKDIIAEGFKGMGKLPDDKLARYLENSNLLSRYPHEVVITK